MSAPTSESSASLAVTRQKDPRLAAMPKATPTDETPTACQSALAIPELLEGILLQLPPRQVLVMQRVHTIFEDCVKECPKLQERLYLRVKEMPSPKDQHPPPKPEVNDALFFQSASNSDHYIFHLSRTGLRGGETGSMDFRVYTKEASIYLQAWDIQQRIHDRLNIGVRSYSKMYLTDFPTTDIAIELWNTDVFHHGSSPYSWERAGLRIKWTTFDMVVQVMQSLREAAEQWGVATRGEKRTFDWKKYFRGPIRELVLVKPHIANAWSSYR